MPPHLTPLRHSTSRRLRLLAGALTASAALAASALAAAPANADATAPTVPDTPCAGDFGTNCTGVVGSTQWSVTNGSDGTPTVAAVGLAIPSLLAPDGTALPYPNSTGPDGGPVYPSPMPSGGTGAATHTWTITVPAGTTDLILKESLLQISPNLPPSTPQLSVTGPAEGGSPVTKTVTGDDQSKTLTWQNPAAGTYTVEIDTQTDGGYDFNAFSTIISPSTDDDQSVFSAQATPDSSAPDTTTTISANWDNLLANTTYWGTVSYSGTDALSLVQIDTGNGYQFQEVAAPQLEGSGTVGSTLTATAGLWAPDPTFDGTFAPTVTYQWSRDYQPIAGATSSTYTLTRADAGHVIGANVIARQRTFSDYSDAAYTSDGNQSLTIAPGTAYATTPPTITGTPRVAKTLTAHPGTWSATDLTFAYQWTANGFPIAGADAQTLKLVPGLAGKKVGVTVTNATDGFTHATAKSSTAAVLATPTVKLKLVEKKTSKKVHKRVHGKRKVVTVTTRHVIATVTVTAPVSVGGKVRVTIAGVTRTVTLKYGKATVDVVHNRTGHVAGSATYTGSGSVAGGTAHASVTVR